MRLSEEKTHDIIVGDGRDGRRDRHALTFHSLRHTAVTLLKEAGIPQAVVMELIGHDKPSDLAALHPLGARIAQEGMRGVACGNKARQRLRLKIAKHFGNV